MRRIKARTTHEHTPQSLVEIARRENRFCIVKNEAVFLGSCWPHNVFIKKMDSVLSGKMLVVFEIISEK